MSKLLRKSKSVYEGAKRYLKSGDDADIDWACVSAHQAIELALKYVFECENIRHPWGHRIDNLITELQQRGIRFNVLDDISRNATKYNLWEAESRYFDSFFGVVSDVQDALLLLDKLYEEIDARYGCTTEVPDEVYSWCKEHAPDAVKELPDDEMLDMMRPLYEAYRNRNK